MYQLEFFGELGSERYEICTQAYLMTDRTIAVAEWMDVVYLQRKFKEIGKPSEQTANGITLLELDGDASIVLERSEMKLLLEFLERPIWRVHVLERVITTRDWLKGIPELERKLSKVPE